LHVEDALFVGGKFGGEHRRKERDFHEIVLRQGQDSLQERHQDVEMTLVAKQKFENQVFLGRKKRECMKRKWGNCSPLSIPGRWKNFWSNA
jgi:hypothetical protein